MESKSSTSIKVALISLLGTIIVALIANADKLSKLINSQEKGEIQKVSNLEKPLPSLDCPSIKTIINEAETDFIALQTEFISRNMEASEYGTKIRLGNVVRSYISTYPNGFKSHSILLYIGTDAHQADSTFQSCKRLLDACDLRFHDVLTDMTAKDADDHAITFNSISYAADKPAYWLTLTNFHNADMGIRKVIINCIKNK
jgi:hypothetical protein